MKGLELILQINNMSFKDLADKLNLSRQNVSMWVSGGRKIPKKYLGTLSETFGVPEEYFQKELKEIDELKIQKMIMENSIVEEEYEDTIIDEDTGDEIPITRTYVDSSLLGHISYLQYQIDEKNLSIKISHLLEKCFEAEDDLDNGLYKADALLRKFDSLISVYTSKKVNSNTVDDVFRAIKLAYNLEFGTRSGSDEKFVQQIVELIKIHDEEKKKEWEEDFELIKEFYPELDDNKDE